MLGLAAGPWVAAVHCGWKGLVAGVVPAVLDALAHRGAALHLAHAHLGPSICPRCYPVDAERAGRVAEVCPTAVVGQGRALSIDVRAGVLAQLAARGIHASADPRCTAEDPALYSYRRDGVTGRQALVILREAA
jgi:copper oxidase (laccase) domain-containing protein